MNTPHLRRRPGSYRWWYLALVVVALGVIAIVAATSGGASSGDDTVVAGLGPHAGSDTRTTSSPTATPDSAATSSPAVTTEGPVTTAPADSPRAGPNGLIPLPIVDDPEVPAYDRDADFGGWADTDHDCQNTRAELLISTSSAPVTFTNGRDCTVATGSWRDPWSGQVSVVARAFDIDHTVPLANAWRSGAWAWSRDRRVAYANDLGDVAHLVAISAHDNRAKGDDGPEAWKPPNPTTWCAYARLWDGIKARWGLSATGAEWNALVQMTATC